MGESDLFEPPQDMTVSRFKFSKQGENKHETHPSDRRRSPPLRQHFGSSNRGPCRWHARLRRRRLQALTLLPVTKTEQSAEGLSAAL